MKRAIGILVVAAVLGLTGCAVADKLLSPGPAKQPSPAEKTLRTAVDTGIVPATWGEIGLAAILAIQNAYLVVRKIQQKRKTTP